MSPGHFLNWDMQKGCHDGFMVIYPKSRWQCTYVNWTENTIGKCMQCLVSELYKHTSEQCRNAPSITHHWSSVTQDMCMRMHRCEKWELHKGPSNLPFFLYLKFIRESCMSRWAWGFLSYLWRCAHGSHWMHIKPCFPLKFSDARLWFSDARLCIC